MQATFVGFFCLPTSHKKALRNISIQMPLKSMVFKALTAVSTLLSSQQPWFMGVPTKLIKKTTLVHPACGDPDGNTTTRLPVHTLTFQIPKNVTFSGKAIPHNNVRLDMGDVVKMVIPGYKPKSYSISALRETEFDVTFKVYPNGRASGFLDRLQVGDYINSFGMKKSTIRNPGSYVGIIAYGVGITEALPVAKAELEKNDAQQVVLLWASRTQADTFWNDDIQELEQQYPTKFKMVYIFSREEVDGCLKGRIDPQILSEVFHGAKDTKEGARFLSVGTKDMMRMTDRMLSEVGFDMPKHALLPKM